MDRQSWAYPYVFCCVFCFSAYAWAAYLPGAGNSSGREHYVYVFMDMKMREWKWRDGGYEDGVIWRRGKRGGVRVVNVKRVGSRVGREEWRKEGVKKERKEKKKKYRVGKARLDIRGATCPRFTLLSSSMHAKQTKVTNQQREQQRFDPDRETDRHQSPAHPKKEPFSWPVNIFSWPIVMPWTLLHP